MSEDKSTTPLDRAVRWRLVLGEAGHDATGGTPLSGNAMALDAALEWLYEREEELGRRDIRGGPGGTGGSVLNVPTWLSEIHRLFPRSAIEQLERDAVERYEIVEVLTSPEALAQVKPNLAMVNAVLQIKHLMRPDVLVLAQKLVAEVVQRLVDQMKQSLDSALAATRASE